MSVCNQINDLISADIVLISIWHQTSNIQLMLLLFKIFKLPPLNMQSNYVISLKISNIKCMSKWEHQNLYLFPEGPYVLCKYSKMLRKCWGTSTYMSTLWKIYICALIHFLVFIFYRRRITSTSIYQTDNCNKQKLTNWIEHEQNWFKSAYYFLNILYSILVYFIWTRHHDWLL